MQCSSFQPEGGVLIFVPLAMLLLTLASGILVVPLSSDAQRPVQVHRIITEGTVEERIAQLLDAKRELADAVLDGGEAAALSELSEQDRELVIARLEWDLSWSEIAEALGKPTPDAARVAVHRAILKLAKVMHRHRAARTDGARTRSRKEKL